ncbi:MAG: hypothetical protein WDZ52_04450 [Pseudohongiellaceae bacterium]
MVKLFSKLFFLFALFCATQNSLQAQSSLAESLAEDASLQEATLLIMRSALGGRDSAAVVPRGGFLLDIQIYVQTYRQMRDANTLANIQNRYRTAKGELLEPRLPATIEELVAVLEMLEQ